MNGTNGGALLGVAIIAYIVGAVFVVVVLSYGYYTWREFIFKRRHNEMTWPQRAAAMLLILPMVTFVIFPTMYFAGETVFDLGDLDRAWQDFQLMLISLFYGFVFVVIMEMILRVKWRRKAHASKEGK